MTSSLRQAAAKKLAEATIHKLRTAAPQGATHTRASALAAHALALRAGSRVLEAEALLLLGRGLEPTPDPRHTLQALQRAQCIFEANGLADRAAVSQVGAAMALYELGEERNAIAAARAAIGNPVLPSADRAGAYFVAGLAHGHLGEVDTALHLLGQHALPLAARSGLAWLLARVKWAQARTQWQVLLHHRLPRLWLGLPAEPGLLQVQAAVPGTAGLLAMLDDARATLPAGQPWPYIDVLRTVVQGLSGERGALAHAAQVLAARHRAQLNGDPPAVAWALLCQAMLLLEAALPQAALETVLCAQALAQSMHMHGLQRDLLLMEVRAREVLGDGQGALAAYKGFALRQLKSATLSPAAEPAAMLAGLWTDPLRELEPPHVRVALRYIEAHLREPLAVARVVAHCRVARRTLETAFKGCKGCTIADYIKQRRLALAAAALANTDQPVQQLAQSLGFGSAARFAQDFRARYGMPPSAWRRHPQDLPA